MLSGPSMHKHLLLTLPAWQLHLQDLIKPKGNRTIDDLQIANLCDEGAGALDFQLVTEA